MALVYKITNTVNGKIYIGFTRYTLEGRWKQHVKLAHKQQYPLQRAIAKHGVKKFKIETLLEDEDVVWCLNVAEPFFIAYYNSTDFDVGYNVSSGGSSTKIQVLDESIKNLSKRQKAVWKNPELRKSQSAIAKLKWQDPDFRRKQSKAYKAIKKDPSYKAKQSAASKANWQNPEYRARISAAVKANWQNPEFLAKQKAGQENRRLKKYKEQGNGDSPKT